MVELEAVEFEAGGPLARLDPGVVELVDQLIEGVQVVMGLAGRARPDRVAAHRDAEPLARCDGTDPARRVDALDPVCDAYRRPASHRLDPAGCLRGGVEDRVVPVLDARQPARYERGKRHGDASRRGHRESGGRVDPPPGEGRRQREPGAEQGVTEGDRHEQDRVVHRVAVFDVGREVVIGRPVLAQRVEDPVEDEDPPRARGRDTGEHRRHAGGATTKSLARQQAPCEEGDDRAADHRRTEDEQLHHVSRIGRPRRSL
jgi:hypothetical protein